MAINQIFCSYAFDMTIVVLRQKNGKEILLIRSCYSCSHFIKKCNLEEFVPTEGLFKLSEHIRSNQWHLSKFSFERNHTFDTHSAETFNRATESNNV